MKYNKVGFLRVKKSQESVYYKTIMSEGEAQKYSGFPKIMQVAFNEGDKIVAGVEKLAGEFLAKIEKAQLSMMADFLGWQARESVAENSSLDLFGIRIEEEGAFLARTSGKGFDKERKDLFVRVKSLQGDKVALDLGTKPEELVSIGRGAYARVVDGLVKKSFDFPPQAALQLRGMALSLITKDAPEATGTNLPIDWKEKIRRLIYSKEPNLKDVDEALAEFISGFKSG